jgi:hypothetical protein
VFVNADKTKVVKFLIVEKCYNYNEEEFNVWKNASEDDKRKMATTSLDLKNGIIEQEFCNPVRLDERKLSMKQILFANKCRGEVGWAKDGSLKCFDLSEFNQY